MKEIESLAEQLTHKLTVNKETKAKIKIQQSVFAALWYSRCDLETIRNFTEDCLSQKIWTSEVFFDGKSQNTYNIFDYLVNEDYTPIIKSLMMATPTLGSPNAATGEFELMLLITTNSKLPVKGDIYHNTYGLKNLKGSDPRIFTSVRGKKLNRIMKSHLQKYGVNLWIHDGIEYGQLMSKNAVNHYNNQFNQRGLSNEDVKDICKIWLRSLFDEDPDINFDFIDGNQINWKSWFDFNGVYIFDKCNDKFDSFMIMKENGEIYHLPQEIENFKKELESGRIVFSTNFFRLNQDKKCGIYFKVN